MRVRVVAADGTRTNARVNASVTTQVRDFLQLVQQQTQLSLPDDAALSLNGKRPLGHTPETPLSALGICSGDLVFVLCSRNPPAPPRQQPSRQPQPSSSTQRTGADGAANAKRKAVLSNPVAPRARNTWRPDLLGDRIRAALRRHADALSSLDTQLNNRGRCMAAAVLAVQLLAFERGAHVALETGGQDASAKEALGETDVFMAAISAQSGEVARLRLHVPARTFGGTHTPAHTIHMVLVLMLDSFALRISAQRQDHRDTQGMDERPDRTHAEGNDGGTGHAHGGGDSSSSSRRRGHHEDGNHARAGGAEKATKERQPRPRRAAPHEVSFVTAIRDRNLRNTIRPGSVRASSSSSSTTTKAILESLAQQSPFSRQFFDQVLHRCAVEFSEHMLPDTLQGQPQEMVDHIASFLPSSATSRLFRALTTTSQHQHAN